LFFVHGKKKENGTKLKQKRRCKRSKEARELGEKTRK